MSSGGKGLRQIRKHLGLTLQDVQEASQKIAALRGSKAFLVRPSRLCDIENKGLVPSVFRFYSLAAIYRKSFNQLLQLYGIDPTKSSADWYCSSPPKSHALETGAEDILAGALSRPEKDVAHCESTAPGKARGSGPFPFPLVNDLPFQQAAYAFIGRRDFTMFPLLRPGSFLQIDKSKNRVTIGRWHFDHERPIYFVETREGFFCGWCELSSRTLILRPHPLSPDPVRMFGYPDEAQIVGQVVAIATRM